MRDIDPRESFIDGVVAHHQYRDFLDLTVPEARNHPDTLEVFDDLTEVVATADELRTAYTGVLRFRGRNREEAEEYVRGVESDINTELHDLEIITSARYQKNRDSLESREGVKKVAEGFVKLFRGVIPADELPARKKRTAPKTTRAPKIEPKSEAVQATRFIVERDESMAIAVNGIVPELSDTENSLFDELVTRAEVDPELYIRSDVLKQSRRWRDVCDKALTHGEREPGFGEAMKSLRASLHEQGLGNMIEVDGTGAGRVYRARVDHVRYAATEPAVNQSDTITGERARKASETDEERTMRFAGEVLSFIVGIVPNGDAGRKISEIRKSVINRTGIEDEPVRVMIRNYLRSGDLHVIGNERGVRLISPEPKPEEEEAPNDFFHAELAGERTESYFSDEELAYVRTIVKRLSNAHLERGVKIKSLWTNNDEAEDIVRATIGKITKLGYIERHTPKLQRAAHSRRNTEPFVRFKNADYWRASKRDRHLLVQKIIELAEQQLISTE